MAATFEFRVAPGFEPTTAARAARVLDQMGAFYADEVRRLMQTAPAGGRGYRRSNPGRFHKASAPGEPPSPDLRTLIHSVASTGAGEGFRRVVRAGVTSAVAAGYVLLLELGTARMRPRPAWLVALQNVRGIPRDVRG